MDSKDELAKNLLIASNSIKNLPSLEEQETLYQQLLHLLVRKCNSSNIYELEEQVSQLRDKSIRQSPYSVPLLSLIITMSPFTKTVIKFNHKFKECLDKLKNMVEVEKEDYPLVSRFAQVAIDVITWMP